MKRHRLQKHAYGLRPDQRDHRDRFYAYQRRLAHVILPKSVDLRNKCSSIDDQGQLGSCTGNGCAGLLELDQARQGQAGVKLSRLMLYYFARSFEGTTKSDSGASIRDVVRAAVKYGACAERIWPYSDDAKTFKKKPSTSAQKAAQKALAYRSVSQSALDIKDCLASSDAVLIGFSVYESFESDEVARTGIMPMPAATEQLLGGHCVLVVGYDDDKQWWICRNSWGSSWGDQGYFYMPYAYLLNPRLAGDFWMIDTVSASTTMEIAA